MSTVLRWNSVRTRKDHKCPLCGRVISKSSPMIVAAWADGGTVFSERFCLTCERYWREILHGEEICFERDCPIYQDDYSTWERIKQEVDEHASKIL